MKMFDLQLLILLLCQSLNWVASIDECKKSDIDVLSTKIDHLVDLSASQTKDMGKKLTQIASRTKTLLNKHETCMDNHTAQLDEIESLLRERQSQSTTSPPTLQGPGCGKTYIRWGRTACPGDANLVYQGYAAGSHYSHSGGGADYQCLPKTPQWGKYVNGQTLDAALIYGAEYQLHDNFNNNPFLGDNAEGQNAHNLHDYEVPCAVCYAPRCAHLMIPAWNTCPAGWHTEYDGYLMAGRYSEPSNKQHVCVDKTPEGIASNTNHDEALFYPVEVRCGSLPCSSDGYVDGRELTCVVCTQ